MQSLDIFTALPIYGKVIFLILLLFLSFWVYEDAEKRGVNPFIWFLAVLLYPVIFPLYLLLRPKDIIGFCRICYRILPKDSEECYFCINGIKDGNEGISTYRWIKQYLYHFCLNGSYVMYLFLGLFLFFYKNKFLSLYFKLAGFFSLSRCHQTVITEGRNIDIPINTLTYGETPFFSAWKIFRFASIGKNDVFYDLGSGTGNVVFLCNILYDIEATGIDAIHTFIDYSMKIKEDLAFDKVNFFYGNFLETNLSNGTVFFIVSTVFDPITMEKLGEKLLSSSDGARIITVSRPFNLPYLKVKDVTRVFFSWGYENVYLHVKV